MTSTSSYEMLSLTYTVSCH